jgi:transposase
MKPKEKDPERFAKEAQAICNIYKEARELETKGTHVISCDEKTGIQARERISSLLPVKRGICERQEYEYTRHGTLCLIANFNVATGQVLTPTLGPTRNEEDFAFHIAKTIDTDPNAEWIFIVDNLNTHQSESMVHLVAKRCKLDINLGEKRKNGILKAMKTRAAFLSNPSHRIRFIYTPKHCSWLNQIESWFSILVRRLLKRASFSSVDALRQRILAFIDYFNAVLAKPFKWTYTGRPA